MHAFQAKVYVHYNLALLLVLSINVCPNIGGKICPMLFSMTDHQQRSVHLILLLHLLWLLTLGWWDKYHNYDHRISLPYIFTTGINEFEKICERQLVQVTTSIMEKPWNGDWRNVSSKRGWKINVLETWLVVSSTRTIGIVCFFVK